ncbi:heavy-metal-associated domain-containing protein [Sphingobacterium anhuiense]|uniref:Heavy-metal-associated domain-containing protein n=1 Tax=Sphingobacterium anhuiense TaxID=493780 RepID=A0ABW5YXT3_9SPHI
MKKIELSIPDMQSANCQTRVNSAVQGIAGITIEKIESGKLFINYEDDNEKKEVIETIEKAGYKVADNITQDSSCATGCCGN